MALIRKVKIRYTSDTTFIADLLNKSKFNFFGLLYFVKDLACRWCVDAERCCSDDVQRCAKQ